MRIKKHKSTLNKAYEQWYAIRVKSNFEFKVFEQLEELQYNVFLPTYAKTSLRKDRKKILNKPLFPGYIFIRCILEHKVKLAIYKVRGFHKFLEVSGRPVPIPDEEIKQIRIVVKSDLLVKSLKGLIAGDPIKVIQGPLIGIAGTYITEDQEKMKFYVNVSFLDRVLEVELESCMFERI